MLFDTHCHFDSLVDARAQLPLAYEADVRAINVIGCDVETTQRSIDVVTMVNDERTTLRLDDLDIRATMGLHPHEAQHLNEQRDNLEHLLATNLDIISGIGETGYDFYYNHSSKDDQTKSFAWQIELAKKYHLAMVIHTRDAWDETFALLDDRGGRTHPFCIVFREVLNKHCVLSMQAHIFLFRESLPLKMHKTFVMRWSSHHSIGCSLKQMLLGWRPCHIAESPTNPHMFPMLRIRS